jgi:FG-GAP repeat protein
MKSAFVCGAFILAALAAQDGGLRSFEIVPLEKVSETSSNASIGDLNGDGFPDILAGDQPDLFR